MAKDPNRPIEFDSGIYHLREAYRFLSISHRSELKKSEEEFARAIKLHSQYQAGEPGLPLISLPRAYHHRNIEQALRMIHETLLNLGEPFSFSG